MNSFSNFIQIPIYRGELGLIVSDKIDYIKNIIPEFETDDLFAHSYYHNHDGNESFTMILNYNHSDVEIKMGTIAHESYHLVSMILDSRGVALDFNNDEPGAYLMEWIFNTIMDWLASNE